MWDRTNNVMHTENDGHETDHQELDPGRGEKRLTLRLFIINR